MAYKVQLKKLIKIVNPFEHNIFKNIKISVEEIEEKISTLDIFPNPSDSESDKILKEIAYKVANYEQGLIQIRLPEMGEVLDEVLLHGATDLCAAIYRQETSVNIELEATPKIAKTLLGVDMNNGKFDFDYRVSSDIVFKWESSGDLDQTWNNPLFILEKILSLGSFEDGLKHFKDLIPKEIINTVKFAEQFCQKRFIQHFPEDWIYKPNMLNVIKSDPELFLHAWKTVYANSYQNFIDGKINIHEHHDQYITFSAIKNGVFNDLDFCKKIMEVEIDTSRRESFSISFIFKDFNKEILFDPHFMNINYFNNPYGYNPFKIFSLKDIPESIVNNTEWQKKFITNFIDFSELSKDELLPLVNATMKNKESIISCLGQNKTLYCAYGLLPKNLKNDPEIIAAFFNANPKTYPEFPHGRYNVEQYLKGFLEYVPKQYSEVPFDDIVSLNDIDVFKILVATDYHILNNKKFPKEFKEDPYVLICAGSNLKFFGDKKIEKTLFENIDIVKQLCSLDSHFYWKAPLNLKRNPEVSLEQLKNNGDIEMYAFASKDFCIEALKINKTLASQIPLPYWDDVGFITTLAKLVDAGDIDSQAFDFAPEKVREYLDSYSISGDFTYFFNKAILREKLEGKIFKEEEQSQGRSNSGKI